MIIKSVVNWSRLWQGLVLLLHISVQNIECSLYSWWIQWNCLRYLWREIRRIQRAAHKCHIPLNTSGKLVTVSNSYPRDKNPPLTVCWRGQWLKEQAPLMSTNLLLMGERGGKRVKKFKWMWKQISQTQCRLLHASETYWRWRDRKRKTESWVLQSLSCPSCL